MNKSNFKWIFLLLIFANVFAVTSKKQDVKKNQQNIAKPFFKDIKKQKPEDSYASLQIPESLDYPDIINQIQKWEKEYPDFVQTGFYGETSLGMKICYLRITNKLEKTQKPKVLITGAIHGNEPWSTACVMAYAGSLIGQYKTDVNVKNLLDTRDIYIVPVVSPDSYLTSRYVDKVDPNRDFPTQKNPQHKSTPSIDSIQKFFNQIKPNAVISGHTFGRIFLIPYGDSTQKCPNDNDYKNIIGEMSKVSKYKINQTCFNYNRPIFGTEVDWYYRNGAFSVVMEVGTHQIRPSIKEIKEEFERTWKAVQIFIEKAPLVKINIEDLSSSRKTSIFRKYFEF